MMQRILWLALVLALLPGGRLAAAAPALEQLNYRVSLGPWQEAARLAVVLRQTGPERYQAEFSGAAQGIWRVLSRWLPERYLTEMVYRDGRLIPMVFREESIIKGEQVVKEYLFNYEKGVLEYWRQAGGGDKVRGWQVPLTAPVYDPLSLLYNIRLGTFGRLVSGTTLRVPGIPTPQPVEMIIHIGSDSDQGRKVMLTLRGGESGKESDPYFIYLTPEGVPLQGWLRVLRFGKLMGTLLNPADIKKEVLAPPPASPGHRNTAGPTGTP